MGVTVRVWILRVSTNALCVVDHCSKDEDTKSKKDDEEAEFINTGTQCVAKHSQPYKVTGQLEDPQDPHKTHHSQESKHICGGFGGEPAQTNLQVEGQNGHKVNDIQQILYEEQLVGTADDAHQELKCKPHHTDALHQCERRIRHHLQSVHHFGSVAIQNHFGTVLEFIEGLMGLKAEVSDRHQDEKERDEGNDLQDTKPPYYHKVSLSLNSKHIYYRSTMLN